MEFTVIKIMDGLLLSDASVVQDYQFVRNNKISHMIGWLQSGFDVTLQYADTEIKSVTLSRKQSNIPSISNIQNCIQAIEQSREQCLCCLIYSERIQYCFVLLIPYFVCRYGWSVNTAVNFIYRKVEVFFKSSQILQYLQGLVENMTSILNKITACNSNKLKTIIWESSFLDTYKTDDLEQQLIINTVKNMNAYCQNNQSQTINKNRKKKRRIQWFDQAPKNHLCPAERLFANSKIMNSLKRNSCLKGSQKSIVNLLKVQKSYETKMQKQRIPSNQLGLSTKQNDVFDQAYLSLKQLSRTNFDDMKYKSCRFNKRRSIKLGKSTGKLIPSHQNYFSNFSKSVKSINIIKSTL